ncbi:uncharacterized protein LOC116844677 [Odontomachus brunneus]|uniref:uncharacterized protein LOC116844677 n=1 Tax=Odontomachus brunneus TaxID=486640 RepID=UPI0013F1A0C1|nr:uncharacterized protein LOC116844677 [Odontomachus brunneus]
MRSTALRRVVISFSKRNIVTNTWSAVLLPLEEFLSFSPLLKDFFKKRAQGRVAQSAFSDLGGNSSSRPRLSDNKTTRSWSRVHAGTRSSGVYGRITDAVASPMDTDAVSKDPVRAEQAQFEELDAGERIRRLQIRSVSRTVNCRYQRQKDLEDVHDKDLGSLRGAVSAN